MIRAGNTHKEIAKGLDRGLSTIKKEVSINGGKKEYNPKKAHQRARRIQYYKKKDVTKVAKDPHLVHIVHKGLDDEASPEAIAGYIAKHHSEKKVSAKAIRNFIKHRPGLEEKLFWNRNKKKTGPKPKKHTQHPDGRSYIEQRPTTEGEYGHWEGDFIVSKHTRYVLLVLVEKLTKFALIKKLPHRSNTDVNRAIVEALRNHKVETLTIDNDIAFNKWRDLEELLDAPVYFTHPYSSFEKGLVENTNRWIRQYIPKRTDLQSVTDVQIQSCLSWLNRLPRGVIDYQIPEYLMLRYEGKLSSINYLKMVSIWG